MTRPGQAEVTSYPPSSPASTQRTRASVQMARIR